MASCVHTLQVQACALTAARDVAIDGRGIRKVAQLLAALEAALCVRGCTVRS